jgi:hypothetical protein
MDRLLPASAQVSLVSAAGHRVSGRFRESGGNPVADLGYIGLTILVFAVLWLLVKGVERFER